MSIKRKIWALPIISTVVFGLGLAVSTYLVTNALTSIRTTEDADYPVLDAAKALTLDVNGISDSLRDAVSEGDKSRMGQMDEAANKIRAKLNKFSALPGQHDNGARLTKEFENYYGPALHAARLMMELEQGDPQAAVTSMQSAQSVLNADLDKTNENAQQQFKSGIAQSAASVRQVLFSSIAVALIVIATLIGVSYFVVRAIWQQLGGEPEYASEIARAVAGGDLAMEIDTDPKYQDSLLLALKEMRDKLAAMVSEIKLSAETINVASREIAAGNSDLANRTESQASSVDETARSMEKLTGTVRQNADNANEANNLALSASDIAVKGGNIVHEVVETMGAINGSAEKIVEIIAVIDGIAFQTNILALNAAVEAARAGEQGRGFAVVATEVRNLAQRSAGAAKEIKALIGDSVAKIGAGSKLVDQAGLTMGDIVDSIKKVADIMADIKAAGNEQTGGIERIGQAIESIDGMTQQNSALVEEASAAAESLREQADQLNSVLSVFKLRAGAAPSKPKAHAAAPKAVEKKAAPATKLPAPSAKPSTPPAPRKVLAMRGAVQDTSSWEEF